jgi:hypothetical protein
MEQKSDQSGDNPLLDLIYINFNFSELINKGNNCLKEKNEKEIKKIHS